MQLLKDIINFPLLVFWLIFGVVSMYELELGPFHLCLKLFGSSTLNFNYIYAAYALTLAGTFTLILRNYATSFSISNYR